jgi:hypothetical protein
MSVLKGINLIRRWVIQTRLKEQGKQGGVMITLPKKDFVDLNTSITAERLMRNGIDPNSITSVNQVENIINQLNKPKVVSQGDPRFKGIMDTMMGKNVIKRDFGKPFKEEIAKMESEATNPRFINYTIDSMKKMEPIDAMREANKIIKREGEYKNLSKEEAKKILDDTEDFIFERNIKPKETDITLDEASSTLDQEIKNAYNKAVREGKFKGTEEDFRNKIDDMMDEDFATGGRVGLKAGMSRRAFLALMGGAGAGIGAAKTGLLKLFGKGAGKQVTKEIIKTPPVAGKPEWFDNLVNKVILEGDDVTKKLSVQDRQVVHNLKIDDMDDVTVYRNLDDGQIRVSYDSPNNMGEQSVELVFKPGIADETTKGKPADQFYAVEAEPRGIRTGPDDYEIEFDGENLVDNVDELISDTSRLKQVARGDKKPTLKEFVESKKKKDKTKALNEDQVEQAEYLETKYGPAPDEGDPNFQNFDRSEDFASGGIARMLGE